MILPHCTTPGLVIAAPRSGSGKTTVTLGLLRALRRRGFAVQPFKCGPDYIDPAFHDAACGRPSYNLDSWAMRRETVIELLEEAGGADLAIAEALMGLFDGVAATGAWDNGSSASIAAFAGWPVILVLDISGQAQTAAATAAGFAGFHPGVEIAGVILNRAGSTRHEKLARIGFARIGMPVFGCIPRRDAVQLPERHLGLVQSREAGDLDARLEALADLIEASVNIDALLKLSICHSAQSPQAGNDWKSFFGPPAQRIAIAQDDAFSFVYPHLLKAWREAGAELLPFSPLADEAPNKAADMVWLPGGYPELHAGRLAVSANFMAGLRSFASTKPVHGECGGYMVLGDGLVDARGERHAMLGLLRLETSFSSKKLHLGYRRAEILSGCVLGPQGTMLSGHEFHYATIAAEAGESLFAMSDSCGASLAGGSLRHGNVTGSFFHIIDKW